MEQVYTDLQDEIQYMESGQVWLELNLNDYGFQKKDPKKYFPTQESRSQKKGWALFLYEQISEQSENLIQGILLGKQVDMDSCGNQGKYSFTPLNTESCHYKDVWCREVVDIKDLRIKEIKDEQEQQYLDSLKEKLNKEQNFMRISSDRDFTYGDGGECRLVKPLYHCKKLGLATSKKQRLKELLNQLGDKTQDFHETCPVQDIIDPELMPNYSNMISDHNQYRMGIKKYRYDRYDDSVTADTNDYVSLRAQYQWIPTKFRIYKNADVQIVGEIHNLPKKDNQELYQLIQSSFQQMLPGWKELNLIDFKNQDYCTLQVVVKAQKYVIQPGQKYSGKWHLEGKTENIVAAGVYYISIDEGFQRDKLQYKPLICYDYGYDYEGKQYLREWELDVCDGCAIVFSNTLPHKFDTLTNSTDKPLERLFMNFFIVDPAKPIIDTEYSMGFEFDIQKGKEKRKQVRENSGKELSGWGYIHYGNSGDVEFIDSFQANNKRASDFRIEHQ